VGWIVAGVKILPGEFRHEIFCHRNQKTWPARKHGVGKTLVFLRINQPIKAADRLSDAKSANRCGCGDVFGAIQGGLGGLVGVKGRQGQADPGQRAQESPPHNLTSGCKVASTAPGSGSRMVLTAPRMDQSPAYH